MSRFNSPPPKSNDFGTRISLALIVFSIALLLISLIKVLLPWLMLVTALWIGWSCRQRYLDFHKRLYRCFYEVLERNSGRISVLEFAMTAHITGPQARSFLDARAKDFFANFEPTNHGDILYTFQKTTVSKDSHAEPMGVLKDAYKS